MRFVDYNNMGLFTDLYELTMAQVYFEKRVDKTAVFNFFIRPTNRRNYFLFSGLEFLIDYLLNLKYTKEDIEFLKSTGKFKEDFLRYLENFRFTGNLYSVDEGEIVFPNEPIVQVEAPILQAQIIETFLINTLQISILVGTKALRCYSVAQDKTLIDFGTRRAHGVDASIIAARSSYIGCFAGTSNVFAGKMFGIPIYGTMAHSFIMAHETEEEAFRNFASVYPDNTIFLIDTYDTIEGLKNAIKVAKKKGVKIKGVRIDSGNLLTLSREVRKILNNNGFRDSIILASGGINEYKIKELVEEKAPIDAFGVGTELVTSADLPYLDCAYKLVEYNKEPKMKLGYKKITMPYKKQLYRVFRDGKILKDVISHFDESVENGMQMLKLYIKDGELIENIPSLQEIKQKTLTNFNTIPDILKSLTQHITLLPEISKQLAKSTEELESSLKAL
jgi:nicotinate phosphoribosyltransferase